MIINNLNLIENYDNNHDSYLNKIIAYNEIISTIDYKWYKSSKRRLLMPTFYLTRFFFNFLKKSFFKNSFRKNVQLNKKVVLLNPNTLYSKKMFLNYYDFSSIIFNTKLKSFFFFKSSINFLKNDKFFFLSKFLDTNKKSALYLNSSFDYKEENKNIFFFKNMCVNIPEKVNFDFFIFFYIYNNSVLEFYKIFILVFFLNSFK